MKRLIAIALCFFATAVGAQGYPTRPVTLVNGFPPGAATDTISR